MEAGLTSDGLLSPDHGHCLPGEEQELLPPAAQLLEKWQASVSAELLLLLHLRHP